MRLYTYFLHLLEKKKKISAHEKLVWFNDADNYLSSHKTLLLEAPRCAEQSVTVVYTQINMHTLQSEPPHCIVYSKLHRHIVIIISD